MFSSLVSGLRHCVQPLIGHYWPSKKFRTVGVDRSSLRSN